MSGGRMTSCVAVPTKNLFCPLYFSSWVLMCQIPDSFHLFTLISHILQQKICKHKEAWIGTRIGGVRGEHTDHWTTTAVNGPFLLCLTFSFKVPRLLLSFVVVSSFCHRWVRHLYFKSFHNIWLSFDLYFCSVLVIWLIFSDFNLCCILYFNYLFVVFYFFER